MNAYFKQVYRGFLNCKKCLLLAFVPLALYLLFASFRTDRFVVSMPLTIGPDTPLADSADSADSAETGCASVAPRMRPLRGSPRSDRTASTKGFIVSS